MPHKKELDYMNGIGCLLVILHHVLSISITGADPASGLAAAVYLPWRLAACAVPMFLCTGAVKTALQFGDAALTPERYLRYILRRFTKIWLPYAAWVVVYYLCYLRLGYVRRGAGAFLSCLLTGNISAPFYYIIVIMQFYLLLPLWVWMLRHVRSYVAIGVCVLVRLCMLQVPGLLAGSGIDFPYTSYLFLPYLVFWVAGLYAGKSYDTFTSAARERPTLVTAVLVIAVYAGLSLREYVTGKPLFDMDQWKLFTDLLSVVLLHVFAVRLTQSGGRLARLLGGIHRASFSVFLSHCLFLTIVTALLQSAGVTRLSVLLPARALVCYTVPFALYYLYYWAVRWWKKLRG